MLHENAANETHQTINLAADAYEAAAASSSACRGLAHHAQFLRSLLQQDVFDTHMHNTLPPAYAFVQPSQQQQQLSQWAASTSSPDSMMYAPSWEMGAFSQVDTYSVGTPQGGAIYPAQQEQFHVESIPVTGPVVPPHWQYTHHNGERQYIAGSEVRARANEGYW